MAGHHDREKRALTCLQSITPNRACWGQELHDGQMQLANGCTYIISAKIDHASCIMFLMLVCHQLTQVLDQTKSPSDHIASVDGTVLTRSDFWTLGVAEDMEGTVRQGVNSTGPAW